MAAAIEVVGVGKRYRTDHRAAPAALKEAALSGFRHLRRREWRWVLRDVDMRIEPGTALGLVGPNGAGKSTLLRLIGGIGRPSEGHISVSGSVGALLELGNGFHGDLSGRESALLAMIVAGRTRREALAQLPDVAAFAGLEDHLEQPLRTFSSGMAARLAFAVATSVEPDLLLVDEVLAVGDLAFQQRCLRRIEDLHRAGATVVLVSHDPGLVAHTCEEVAWLRGGRLVAHGAAAEVLDAYVADNTEAALAATPDDLEILHTAGGVALVPGANRVGSQAATVDDVRLLDGWGAPTESIAVGSRLVARIRLTVPEAVGAANLSLRVVRSSDRSVCVDTSTLVDERDREVVVEMERLDLAPGAYEVQAGLFDPTWAVTHDHHSAAYPLVVRGEGPHSALLAPPVHWTRCAPAEASDLSDGRPAGSGLLPR